MKKNSFYLRSVGLIMLALLSLQLYSQREEFNGPFASWANVKTRFKAKGDGRTDDTRALQAAIDSLSVWPVKFNTGPNAYSVIYLPKGRYRITQTLELKGKIGFAIIGEDPQHTIIEWAGNDKDTMLWANGSAYYKISRLTWTSSKPLKEIEGIGMHWFQSWKTKESRSFASLNIEISDCIFKQLTVGIGGGIRWNDSEVKVARCHFIECSRAGIEIQGHNALDYWVWHCRFINCGNGIYCSRGNYHLYYSYFYNSAISDITNSNGYYSSVRGCFSEKSTAFSIDKGSSSNPFKRTFQDNIVKQPGSLPVLYHHIGKPTFMGNRFDKISPKIGALLAEKISTSPAVLSYTSWMGTYFNVLSVKNRYFYREPFVIKGKFQKVYSAGDTYGEPVNYKSETFVSQLPGFLPYVQRPVFDVPLNAGADQIQAIINKAARMKNKKAIVHFPYGEYTLDKTLVIPKESDIQLVGDGLRYASVLKPATRGVFTDQTLVKVLGPSYIEIKELQFGTSGKKTLHAISFDAVDQQNASVQIDQLYSNCDTTLFIDRLNYTRFEKNNSFFADGNVIIGGDLQKAGKGTLSVNCFGGQYSRLEVRNNAKFVSKDCWWEGATPVPLDLRGDGDITIDGTKIAPRQADSMPIVKIGRFNGKISLMNMYIQGGIEIEGNNPSLKFFLWNANFYYQRGIIETIPKNFRGQLAYAGLTAQCFEKDDPVCRYTRSFTDEFRNVKDENAFVEEMTAQDRAAIPQRYRNLPQGTSNIYLTRVTLDTFIQGLTFSR